MDGCQGEVCDLKEPILVAYASELNLSNRIAAAAAGGSRNAVINQQGRHALSGALFNEARGVRASARRSLTLKE